MIECAIIGGGPAGLSAALVLGRAKRHVTIFDEDKPRNAVTNKSHGYLTRDQITPREFKDIAIKEVLQYPTVSIEQETVTAITKISSGFAVHMSSGREATAKYVLLATGLVDVLPDIPGLRDFYGHSLYSCPFCDGWEMRDRPLAVIIDQPQTMHYAMMISNWTDDLILFTNGADHLNDIDRERLAFNNIAIIESPITNFSGENKELQTVHTEDGRTILRTGGFIAPHSMKPPQLVDSLNLARTEHHGLQVNGFGETSLEGMYAAGDTALNVQPQLINAASEGSKVASMILKRLIEEEFYKRPSAISE
ncbi:NAD(P)/FAD-dependent oxidoreductase [Paenalkalicoccus suaedae]|uniref:NAD(P)/FAD-dependent oxidoreductase n=1 Tax=Paenalkalicoccus suaedae TaxID=2592382 RepID=A0A859FC43_9BACI|nr:NAD(P)/FAD-dependent oxidoreductase [Paenalkalicoccus suaedae]QKS70342.1 NAD(P)/FAD-dependent oxidoreductase [Paenalkalicoccus suaedae]